MEIENVNSKANTGVAVGSVGLGLGALALLGGHIFGNGILTNRQNYATKDDITNVKELMEKDQRIAILESEKYGDEKLATVYEKIMTRVNSDQREQSAWNSQQMVNNAQMSSAITANATSISALQNCCSQITKLVVPNSSVCPGWGEITITPKS